MDSAALHFDLLPVCERETHTHRGDMNIRHERQGCIGERAWRWIELRFPRRSDKELAGAIGESPHVVRSYRTGTVLPSQRKITAWFVRFPEMVPFVVLPWLPEDHFQRAARRLEEARKIIDEVTTWEAKR
jgi:hypothetical protein